MAIAILATAMVILLEAHAASVRISDSARRMTKASALARDLMTEFELQGFPAPGMENGDFEQWYPGMYPDYRWEIEIMESMFWQNVREVYVKVLWMEGGDPRQVEVANFIAAMNEEEQDIAAAEGSGVAGDMGSFFGAYEDAASQTKGAGMADMGGGF